MKQHSFCNVMFVRCCNEKENSFNLNSKKLHKKQAEKIKFKEEKKTWHQRKKQIE